MFKFLIAQMTKNETKPDKKFNPFSIMTVVNTIFVDGFTKHKIFSKLTFRKSQY